MILNVIESLILRIPRHLRIHLHPHYFQDFFLLFLTTIKLLFFSKGGFIHVMDYVGFSNKFTPKKCCGFV